MMTEQQFDARLTVIEDQAAAKQERVDGYRDQKMAALFVESKWSQEGLAAHLAKRWGKEVARQWVEKHLRFGRFLRFFATDCSKDEWKIPTNLTEGAFRRFWEQTTPSGDFRGHKANTKAAEQDERRRFGLILEELQQVVLTRPKKYVKEALIKAFAGKSEWLTKEQMAERLDLPVDSIYRCLRGAINPSEKSPYRLEKSARGDEATYRIVKIKGKMVDRKQMSAYSHEVIPMMEELVREAQKDRTDISLSKLSELASKIKGVLQSLTSEIPSV